MESATGKARLGGFDISSVTAPVRGAEAFPDRGCEAMLDFDQGATMNKRCLASSSRLLKKAADEAERI